jgi:hypothetical protein
MTGAFFIKIILSLGAAGTGATTPRGSTLHGALYIILFPFCILALEQGHIEFSKTIVELEAEKLGVPSADSFLGKSRGLGVDIVHPGSEDIADAERQ